MSLLALDTATEACSAAVLLPDRMVSRCVELARGHSEQILPMIDAVLAEAGLELPALDAIAFGRGPGSFTGVRLAIGVAQGLAFGARRPVVPVSDLRALAQQTFDLSPAAASVLVCSDARMHEVYWAAYRRDARGLAEALCAERVSPAHAVALPSDLPRPTYAAGRGFRAYPELARALEGGIDAMHNTLLPRASEVARLAVVELAAGRGVSPEAAVPQYLRDDVARPPSRD